MKHKNLIFVAVICLIATLALSFSGCSGLKKIPKDVKWTYNPAEWDVTFEDNFDGDKLDTSKWMVGDMYRNEHIRRAAYYSGDNVFVRDGKLVIRTDYRKSEYGEGWHTGWVQTATNVANGSVGEVTDDFVGFSQKGGYFEVRCQAPPAEGIWSAFWLMPDEGVAFSDDDIQGTGKDGVEIDIMESPGYANKKDAVAHVLHCDGYDSRLKSVNSGNYEVKDMFKSMHTYALEWTDKVYRFYIDGYLTWETEHVVDGKVFGVSEVLQYMILSVEVGGHSKDGVLYPGVEGDGKKSWAGNPNKNNKSKNYDFLIDYVKVMQRK